ncbi:MAG: cupin domain-containing protein [Actinobacteria bacterium]|nr:cupin domain-containing protein [Actinomycetota bacterium]
MSSAAQPDVVEHDVVQHWDDLPWTRREAGHIAADWQSLAGQRTRTVGVQRIRIDAGRWSTPAHVENSEEEIFYVLAGSGVSWQDGACFDVAAGDCLVHTAGTEAHTLRAGSDGLEVLAFGERHLASGARLPRAGVSWGLGAWVKTGDPEDQPWKLEAAAGEPEVADSIERPAWIVNVADVEPRVRDRPFVGASVRDLTGNETERTGLRLSEVVPGKLNCPPHCHSAEEEIFIAVAGGGELELWAGVDEIERVAIRPGHIVCRPAGTGVAHAFRAGEDGLSVLMYGSRRPDDTCWYPRSNKILFAGLNVMARVESLDYWDGED